MALENLDFKRPNWSHLEKNKPYGEKKREEEKRKKKKRRREGVEIKPKRYGNSP